MANPNPRVFRTIQVAAQIEDHSGFSGSLSNLLSVFNPSSIREVRILLSVTRNTTRLWTSFVKRLPNLAHACVTAEANSSRTSRGICNTLTVALCELLLPVDSEGQMSAPPLPHLSVLDLTGASMEVLVGKCQKWKDVSRRNAVPTFAEFLVHMLKRRRESEVAIGTVRLRNYQGQTSGDQHTFHERTIDHEIFMARDFEHSEAASDPVQAIDVLEISSTVKATIFDLTSSSISALLCVISTVVSSAFIGAWSSFTETYGILCSPLHDVISFARPVFRFAWLFALAFTWFSINAFLATAYGGGIIFIRTVLLILEAWDDVLEAWDDVRANGTGSDFSWCSLRLEYLVQMLEAIKHMNTMLPKILQIAKAIEIVTRIMNEQSSGPRSTERSDHNSKRRTTSAD
ncbi:hypothetical protein PENSPDRAFT_684266 [Peniophora sp. CONT]|nr:hypothetical protein PENSPDRAFT_684266 [Peniophora sp. CONT]